MDRGKRRFELVLAVFGEVRDPGIVWSSRLGGPPFVLVRQFLSVATGGVTEVATISGWPTEGLSVSPDGRSLLFSQSETGPTLETDLMLVENFW
jgi:hypothetical protein